jgi:hypothetical protein
LFFYLHYLTSGPYRRARRFDFERLNERALGRVILSPFAVILSGAKDLSSSLDA